jgi:hypothetical protein
MAKKSNNHNFPTLHRVRQLTDDHCGPAVVEIMASYIGINVDQDAIVLAAGAKQSIKKRVMTMAEIGTGFIKLFPECTFWFKHKATVHDLDKLVNQFHYPIGVEWQGDFGKYAYKDDGHYCVITAIDITQNIIVLSDPFYYFSGKDRTFQLDNFIGRWWDINDIIDPITLTVTPVKDTRLLFFLTKKEQIFPQELHLHRLHLQK